MKRSAPKTEKNLLLTFLETKDDEIRALILKFTEPEDFGLNWAYEVRERIELLLRLHKPIGSAIDLSEDPALSKEAQKWIKSTARNRRVAKNLPQRRVEFMIRTLHRHRKMRILDDGMEAISKEAEGSVGDDEELAITQTLEGMLQGMRRTAEKDPFLHLGQRADIQYVQKFTDDLLDPDKVRFISTGLDALDQHLVGFEPGNLVTLSGPSGGGKTLVANHMAIRQYLDSKLNVCVVSMEMMKHQLFQRTLANLTQMNHGLIRAPSRMRKEQIQNIRGSVKKFVTWGKSNGCDFSIRDVSDPDYTPHKMVAELAPLQYDVIYVDYITLFSMKGFKSVWEMQMEYSRYLTIAAKDLGCVIVVLTQLSDDDKIKYGRAIKENTDYWIWWSWDATSREFNETDLNLEKARHAEGHAKFRAKFNFAEMSLLVYGRSNSGYVPDAMRMKSGSASGFDAAGAF